MNVPRLLIMSPDRGGADSRPWAGGMASALTKAVTIALIGLALIACNALTRMSEVGDLRHHLAVLNRPVKHGHAWNRAGDSGPNERARGEKARALI